MGGVSRLWQKLATERQFNDIIFDDIDSLKFAFRSCQKAKDIDEPFKQFVIFRFNQGQLERVFLNTKTNQIESEPTCYVHFQKRNMKVTLGDDLTQFLIVPNTFIPLDEVTAVKIKKWGASRLFYKKYFQIRWNNVKRKIKERF